jgi:hypothetical protein
MEATEQRCSKHEQIKDRRLIQQHDGGVIGESDKTNE